jgi:nucleolin
MATDDARKLFVAGLPDSIDEEALRQLFEATGSAVVQVSLPRDRATGRLRGFGFVTLDSAEGAERARDQLDGSLQAGRSISVRPFSSDSRRGPGLGGEQEARPRPEGRPFAGAAGPAPAAAGGGDDRSIYVGNLPYDVDRPGLDAFLKELGVSNVVRVHLPTTPEGKVRGFAFISMTSAEAVQEALQQLRNAEMGGRRLVVNAAHARGERPERPAYGPRPGGSLDRPPADRAPERRAPREAGEFAPAAPPPQRSSFDARDFDGRRDGKKKKVAEAKKKRAPAATDDRRRGGGNTWRKLDDDDWSDE